MQRYPNLTTQVISRLTAQERVIGAAGVEILQQQRFNAIKAYLVGQWKISANRITLIKGQTPNPSSQVRLQLRLNEIETSPIP
ncbi:MAG: hypothetical protein WA902_12780 [Thermosynechococcaceae cyanobacterium]